MFELKSYRCLTCQRIFKTVYDLFRHMEREGHYEKRPAPPPPKPKKEVVVALLDTGVDSKHPDLASKVIREINVSESKTVQDLHGHGTHVASIIVRKAPNARLISIKIANDKGWVWQTGIVEGIREALRYLIADRVKVINSSFYVPNDPRHTVESAVNMAWANGMLLLCAAGNGIKGVPAYPAAFDNVLAVAAVDNNGKLWKYSNFGPWVDCYAPGVDIYSAKPGGGYRYESGTSMACACVSGTAASIWGDMDYSRDQIAQILKATFPKQQ